MSEIYEPDSQFLDRLEWQLSSEYRRKTRMKSIPGKIAVPRKLAAIAILVGALTAGVSVVKATEYFKDAWRKRIEIARIETDVKLKTTHLESTIEMVTLAENRFSNGLTSEEEYRALEHAVSRADLGLKTSLLNLDEVIASGDVPRNELYAYVVDGRDFVSERLQVTRRETELDIEYARNRLGRLRQKVEGGLVNEAQLDHIKAEIAAQEVNIDKIQKRLELRKRFVSGIITAQEVEIEGRITVAERNLHLAKSRVDILQAQLKRFNELESRGMISQLEVTQVEFALNAAQAELKLAALELDILREVR